MPTSYEASPNLSFPCSSAPVAPRSLPLSSLGLPFAEHEQDFCPAPSPNFSRLCPRVTSPDQGSSPLIHRSHPEQGYQTVGAPAGQHAEPQPISLTAPALDGIYKYNCSIDGCIRMFKSARAVRVHINGGSCGSVDPCALPLVRHAHKLYFRVHSARGGAIQYSGRYNADGNLVRDEPPEQDAEQDRSANNTPPARTVNDAATLARLESTPLSVRADGSALEGVLALLRQNKPALQGLGSRDILNLTHQLSSNAENNSPPNSIPQTQSQP